MAKFSKREFLKTTTLLGAATIPASAVAVEHTSTDHPDLSKTSLLDSSFTTDSGWGFASQAIHHGEQEGYQVTPISQDKCTPGIPRLQPC